LAFGILLVLFLMSSEIQFAIGVDGGGTGCRTVIVDRHGNTLGRGTGGPSNIATNLDEAVKNIQAAINAAAKDITVSGPVYSLSSAVLGLAGANVGDHARRLAERLGFARSKVVSDAQTSLNGALGGADGTGAMIGTGSVFASRKDGVFRQLGGWGFQIGDQAGGARLGRCALEETLLAHDGIRQGSDLTRAMLVRYGGAPAITEFARKAAPGEYAALAPLVIEAAGTGDAVATEIVDMACAYIEKAVNAVSFDPALPVTMIGGLSQSLAPFLSDQLRAKLVPATGNALDGAARMALELLTSEAANA
jgi:glucosamine kinase